MWTQRAARARFLAGRYAASREVLIFYAGLAEWQGRVARKVTAVDDLDKIFPSLLDLVAQTGPALLREAAGTLRADHRQKLLEDYWERRVPAAPLDFFARAALQPYAGSLPANRECPWCSLPPQAGALLPQGEGLALELVCALCLRRRPFPRARCPGCNESTEAKLPGFSTPEFAHLRLQACDTCQGYFQLVDLSRDPSALPEVDELAGLPLDLWAAEQGYHKLQRDLAGI